VFSKQPSSRERIARAGGLLGEIHRVGMQQRPSASASELVSAELERSREQLDDLVGRGALDRREADALGARIAQARVGSTRAHSGIVHGDFAPENLVLDETGALRIVDNESVQPGLLDLDLSRVWARWPMPAHHWQAFLDAYAERAGRACSDAGLDAWKVRALLVSAWYRTAFGLAGAAPALDHLRRFHAVPGRVHPASPGAEAS
jgi:aminoglycoside phosphotransferase (APT) family kinase protein